MRRARILSVMAALLMGAVLVWLWPEPGPSYGPFKSAVEAPSAGSGQARSAGSGQARSAGSGQAPSYVDLSYEFLSPNPFEGGRMWVTLRLTTNSSVVYYYDIEQRKVLGKLRGAQPVFEPEPGVKLLCKDRTVPNGFKNRLARFAARVTFGRLRLPMTASDNHVETFWLLDLKRNSAIRLGTTEQFPGAGSSFWPSPDGKLAFNKSTGSFASAEVLLFDATVPSIGAVTIGGWPIGWWSNHEILFKSKDDFMLYDVPTGSSNKFLTVGQLEKFFQQHKLDAYPKEASIFPMWNGKEYDFYFTEGNSRWGAVESYLGKVRRPGPTLELMAPEFKFEWSDSLDPSGRYYVFSGRRSGAGSAGVRVRELNSGRETVLVPDDGGQHFSLPNLYRDSVIYVRSNALWRISLTGSNSTRLFPPP